MDQDSTVRFLLSRRQWDQTDLTGLNLQIVLLLQQGLQLIEQQQDQNSRHICINETFSVPIKTGNKIYKISRILSIQPMYICLTPPEAVVEHEQELLLPHFQHSVLLWNKLDILVQREKKSLFWILGLGSVFALLWFFIKKSISKKLAFTQGNKKLYICKIP